jgi:hypothetical protein
MTIEKDEEETYVVEWFDGDKHVFDCCSLSASDVAALEKIEEVYVAADIAKKAEIRGMLRLVEDGLTNGYVDQSAEVLSRVLELDIVKRGATT